MQLPDSSQRVGISKRYPVIKKSAKLSSVLNKRRIQAVGKAQSDRLIYMIYSGLIITGLMAGDTA